MRYSKVVLLPIRVPMGKFCRDGKRCCGRINYLTEGVRCEYHLYPLKIDNKKRILKPKECLELKEERRLK